MTLSDLWFPLFALVVLLLVFAWFARQQLTGLGFRIRNALEGEEKMPDGTPTANSPSAPSIETIHDRQNKIDVRTASVLAYIITFAFFLFIYLIITNRGTNENSYADPFARPPFHAPWRRGNRLGHYSRLLLWIEQWFCAEKSCSRPGSCPERRARNSSRAGHIAKHACARRAGAADNDTRTELGCCKVSSALSGAGKPDRSNDRKRERCHYNVRRLGRPKRSRWPLGSPPV